MHDEISDIAFDALQDVHGDDTYVRDAAETAVGSGTIPGIWGTIVTQVETERGERYVDTRTLQLQKSDLATIDPGYQFSDDNSTWWDLERMGGDEYTEQDANVWVLNLVQTSRKETGAAGFRGGDV